MRRGSLNMNVNRFIFVFACLGAIHVSAAPLVKDGSPAGEFVLAKSPAGAESFAANDVRDWIEKITGAAVPILNEPSTKANLKVSWF
jgi:hypothetical protein